MNSKRDSIQEQRDRERLQQRVICDRLHELTDWTGEEFVEWMNTPNEGLMGKTPQDMMDEGKSYIIEEMLNSIEHGGFS